MRVPLVLASVALAALLVLVVTLSWSEQSARHEAEQVYEKLQTSMSELTKRTHDTSDQVAKQRARKDQLTSEADALRADISKSQRELEETIGSSALLQQSLVSAEDQLRAKEKDVHQELAVVADDTVVRDFTLKARTGELSRERIHSKALAANLEALKAQAQTRPTRTISATTNRKRPHPASENTLQMAKDTKLEKEPRKKGVAGGDDVHASSFVVIYIVDDSAASWSAMRANLALLDINMLTCFPHAIHIFADKAVPENERNHWIGLVPHAHSVNIESVCFETCNPPGHSDMVKLAEKATTDQFSPFESALSRFMSGPLYTHPAFMQRVAYLYLEPTTFIVDPLPEDPFMRFESSGCDLATGKITKAPTTPSEQMLFGHVLDWVSNHQAQDQPGTHHEIPDSFRAHTLWPDTTVPELKEPLAIIETQPDRLWATTIANDKVQQLYQALGQERATYHAVAYSTHGWEMGRFDLGRSDAYQALFWSLDASTGFYTQAWSFNTLRPMAAALFSSADAVCQISSLRHARWPLFTLTTKNALEHIDQAKDRQRDNPECPALLDKALSSFYRGTFVQ